MSSKKPYNPTP